MSNLSQFFGNSAKEVNVWADGATETRQYQVGPRNSFPFIPKTVGISNNRTSLPIGPGKHYDSGETLAAQGGGLHHFAGLWMHASATSATGIASIYTSPDGVVWTARTSGFLNGADHKNYQFTSNGSIVLCTGCIPGGGIAGYTRQTDGVTWTLQGAPGPAGWGGYPATIEYLSDGYFYYAYSHGYSHGIFRSTTGLYGSWTAVTAPAGVLKIWKIGSYYYCNTFTIGDLSLKTFYSTDLSNWTLIQAFNGMCIADYHQVGQRHIITGSMAAPGLDYTPQTSYEFVVSADGTPASWSRKLRFSAYDIDINASTYQINGTPMIAPAGSFGNDSYGMRESPIGNISVNSFAVYKNRLVQIFSVSANSKYESSSNYAQTKIYVITTVNGESMKIYGPVTSGILSPANSNSINTYNGISGIATSSDSSQLGIAAYSFGLALADDNAKELVINA